MVSCDDPAYVAKSLKNMSNVRFLHSHEERHGCSAIMKQRQKEERKEVSVREFSPWPSLISVSCSWGSQGVHFQNVDLDSRFFFFVLRL